MPGCADLEAEDEVDGVSWMFSVSYETPWGVRPYITASEQSTVIAGQGAELNTMLINSGSAFDTSELIEAGIKGSLLDGDLYFGGARGSLVEHTQLGALAP